MLYNKDVQKFITYDLSTGGEKVATGLTKITFTVTEDMEALFASAKKNLFYDRTKSDMIRELVMAGLHTLDEKDSQGRSA